MLIACKCGNPDCVGIGPDRSPWGPPPLTCPPPPDRIKGTNGAHRQDETRGQSAR